jgi:RimJ/RimL family protein N-acetyltransferase
MQDPHLVDIPDVLESERLRIRRPEAGDGAIVHEAIVETLDQLRGFGGALPWALEEPRIETSEIFCRKACAAWFSRTAFPMLLFLKDDNMFVGCSGLHNIEWSVPRFEIGYWCRKSQQHRGLITEAVNTITAMAFSQLAARRVQSLPDEENGPSRRVCERAGYQLEGIVRNYRAAPNGEMRNTCIYATVRWPHQQEQ